MTSNIFIRKEFTISERVAIGKSVAARLGERHGGDRKSEEFQAAEICGLTGETRDLAAGGPRVDDSIPQSYADSKGDA